VLLDLADATGMVPGRAGLSIDTDISLPAPEAGDPGSDPEAFLKVPALLEAQRSAPGELPGAASTDPVAAPVRAAASPG
jgi:hypothetical protein